MDKITQVNIEGHNYGFVAGQAVRGVSGAQAADYVKTVILPEGASLVEGMLLAVTFVNGNTAGFSGSISVYSSDGETFYYDAQMTDPVVLPPDHCYSIEHVSGDEYVYLAYVCLSINNVLTPVSNASGYLSGGPLWESGDTVLFVYFSDFFMMTKQNSGPSDYSRQGAYCDTAGSVQAKVAEMVGYSIQNGQDFPITFTEANTYAGKITLSINGTTACDVYIKNAVSSSSNYTLPAGTYIVHYENSKYYIETAWGVPFARIASSAQACSGNSATATSATSATTAGTASNLNGNLIKALKNWVQLDLSSLNVNYWYPVTFSLTTTGSTEVECYVSLDSGTKPSWSTHKSGFTCHLHLLVMGSGWGTTGGQTVVLDKHYAHASADPCGWTQMGHSSTGVLWLRGGGKYRVWNSRNETFTIRTSKYTVSEESVSPQTSTQFSFIRGQMYGNLNGTLTGNCSGSSSSCTGNSATATTANRVRTSAPSSPVNGDIWVV